MAERSSLTESRVRRAVKGALDAMKSNGISIGAVIVSDDGQIRIEAAKDEAQASSSAADLIDWSKH